MAENKASKRRQPKLNFRSFIAGWSLTRLLIGATLICGVVAVWGQFALLTHLSGDLGKAFETEIAGRLQARLEAQAPQFTQNIASRNTKSLTPALRRLLASDSQFLQVGIYDASGRLLVQETAGQFSRTRKDLFEQVVPWQRLPARAPGKLLFDIQTHTLAGVRTGDAILRLDVLVRGKLYRAGYARVVVSYENLDARLEKIKLFGALPAFLFVLGSALCLMLIIRETLLKPINRVTQFIRLASRNLDQLPRQPLRLTDAAPVRTMVKALFDGISEISLRHKTLRFLEASRAALNKADDATFLSVAQQVGVSSGIAQGCRLFVARENREQRKFFLEKSSDKTKENTPADLVVALSAQSESHTLMSRNSLAEMRYEVVLQFLKNGAAQEWSQKVLLMRTPLGNEADLHLVAMISPHSGLGLPQDKFEQLTESWLGELSRLYHQVRYQDFVANLELSHEMQRLWVQSVPANDLTSERLMASLGYESVPCRIINGDFLCVFKYEKRNCSLVVLGDVSGHELRAGLAATGIVAALSDRFHALKDEAPHVILEELMQSINRYMWASYGGDLATGAQGIFFNHETGQGLLSCFGQPFPYVISPQERKPMVVVPHTTHGLLGIDEVLDYSSTPFSILPGQALFACTDGILETEDMHGKKFEKVVQRGALADVTQSAMPHGAPALLQKYLECVRAHAGNNAIHDDLTGVVLLSITASLPPELVSLSK